MITRRPLLAAAAVPTLPGAARAADMPHNLNVFVPAAPGGGWDGLGRALELVARPAGLVGGFQFENLAGAAGTVGLARFVAQRRGRADSLFIGGASLVGATIVNRSPVSLADITPIARLTEEAAVLVVPPDSEFRTMRQLGEALRAEPRGIPIAGAGGGTVDHVILGLLLKAIGRRPLEAQFVSFSGGGATTAAVMGGQVKAAVAGWGEFEEHVKAGRVRALATSGERRLAPEVPTLKESGYDVVATNWRGIFAAPGITADARATLARFAAALHDLPAWKALLQTRGWDDAFLDGETFEAFLRRDRADTEGVLKELGLA
ncbi:Bug family tripartite tricarboxylate transporter substrate binding protein [Pararoseomonas indoligenes]|uniref:Tripartite tricarboxylate transporter substrate binding protein n=1 Tax=Roseomonas indoligenes TaxID=2820811 RepID=A0A940N499_9PROT|nr:tripartite tricarboxylate transporter substrate-binding protein [Pararoseomonas indoligenes]MBP0496412.1 tripartite tricarboxylate transporter substrate binding protein [Pararoseomonas indoligenes]